MDSADAVQRNGELDSECSFLFSSGGLSGVYETLLLVNSFSAALLTPPCLRGSLWLSHSYRQLFAAHLYAAAYSREKSGALSMQRSILGKLGIQRFPCDTSQVGANPRQLCLVASRSIKTKRGRAIFH